MQELAAAYPVTRLCAVLGTSRSAYYYRPAARPDQDLREGIAAVLAQFPTYGYRRITAQLQRQGWRVNAKRVRRVLRQMGGRRRKKRPFPRTTDSTHGFRRFPNRVRDLGIDRPDQVWVADLTYIRLRTDFVYLAVLMDVFTRMIRGWHLAPTLGVELTLTALEHALA